MRQLKIFIKWLYPGLKVKRWLFLALAGMGLFLWGLLLIIQPHFKVFSHGSQYYLAIAAIIIGILTGIIGLHKAGQALAAVLHPHRNKSLVEFIYHRRYLEKGPKVVALGGGTGLSTILRGFKNYTSNITAVVTVADDGGSSGKLRGELGMLPPGDLRDCLLALADTEASLEELFQFRFSSGQGLDGHNFGNLLIAAMTEMYGFERALKEFSRVLAVKGEVLPVTLDNIRLKAAYNEGFQVFGESRIGSTYGSIKKISLDPPNCQPLPGVLRSLQDADIIILGPGSLYTSLIPNLLVPGVAEAIRKSKGLKFYVCNLMTQKGETAGMTASQHLSSLEEHGCSGLVDVAVVNSKEIIGSELKERYSKEGSRPVRVDLQEIEAKGVGVISAPLYRLENGALRHDSEKLALLILREFLQKETGLESLFSYKLLDLHMRYRNSASRWGEKKKVVPFMQKADRRG